MIIESTAASPAEIAEEILAQFEEYKKNPFDKTKVFLCTKTLTEGKSGYSVISDGPVFTEVDAGNMKHNYSISF